MKKRRVRPRLRPWLWAVEEQLSILRRFDAVGIYAAKAGEFANYFGTFRSEYSLTRGASGSFLRLNKKKFIRVCDQHFRKKPKNLKEAQGIWIASVRDLQKGTGLTEQLWSATLKAYWFYQPRSVPMYDQNVRKGLSQEERRFQSVGRLPKAITPGNYLQFFEAFYERSRPLIEEALAFVDRDYPFPLRIADKYLWHIGNDTAEDPVGQFQKGLRIAPYRA